MTCQRDCKACLCQPDQASYIISLAQQIPLGMKLLLVMRKQNLTNTQITAILDIVLNDICQVCLEANYAYNTSGTRVQVISKGENQHV